MRRLTLIGHGLALLSLGFLVYSIVSRDLQVLALPWHAGMLGGLILAAVLTAGTIALNACVWFLMLRAGKVQASPRLAYSIYGQAQIAKYLPGNVFQYLGRVALARRHDLPLEPVVLTTGLEMLLAVAVAAIFGCLGIVSERPDELEDLLSQTRDLAFPATVIAAVGILAAILVAAAPRVRAWLRARLVYIGFRTLSVTMAVYAVVFLIYGVSMVVLFRSAWGLPAPLGVWELSWRFALAWVLGFVVPGAPGGVGIREAALLTLFQRQMGLQTALDLAILLRVVTVLGDLLAFASAHALRPATTRPAPLAAAANPCQSP
jgi:hypothetical protein